MDTYKLGEELWFIYQNEVKHDMCTGMLMNSKGNVFYNFGENQNIIIQASRVFSTKKELIASI